MKVIVSPTAAALGQRVARRTAELLGAAIAAKGGARLLVSTGASQFTTFEALVKESVDWDKVEMFHLDEYIGLSPDHPASFVKYLRERFTEKVPLKAAHFVDMERGADAAMSELTAQVRKAPIDVGLIGIGENAHIAFNDPPADFDDDRAFKVVTLDERCRAQQLGEGWFKTMEEIPRQAVTMTVKQILSCAAILSAVPYKVKAEAVRATLTAGAPTPMVPATALTSHPDWSLYLDEDSASMLDEGLYCKE